MVDRQVFVRGSWWCRAFLTIWLWWTSRRKDLRAQGRIRLEQVLAAAVRRLMAERRFKYTCRARGLTRPRITPVTDSAVERRSRLPHQLHQRGQLVLDHERPRRKLVGIIERPSC